jgi:multimeric flavodoxin WrbA
MRIAAFVGSPRRNMNTDTLVGAAARGAASQGADVETVYLDSLEIGPCKACRKHPAPNHCFFFDDMQTVYEILENADGVILGSPIYYGTVPAQVKLMIDRANCLTWISRDPDGRPVFTPRLQKVKKGVVLMVSDTTRDPSAARTPIRLFFHDARIEQVGELFIPDADAERGARNAEQWLQAAHSLGVQLARAISEAPPAASDPWQQRHGDVPPPEG